MFLRWYLRRDCGPSDTDDFLLGNLEFFVALSDSEALFLPDVVRSQGSSPCSSATRRSTNASPWIPHGSTGGFVSQFLPSSSPFVFKPLHFQGYFGLMGLGLFLHLVLAVPVCIRSYSLLAAFAKPTPSAPSSRVSMLARRL